jgi:hypothetical protein
VLAGADELELEQAARPRPAVRARAAAAAPPVVTALIYVSFDVRRSWLIGVAFRPAGR